MKRMFILTVVAVCLASRAFGQTELITNGGFEYNLSAWFTNNGTSATITTNVHSGAAALALTTMPASTSGELFQPITIPTNTFQTTLTYYYNIFSVDGAQTPNAQLTVFIANMAGNPIATVDTKLNTDRDTVAGQYHGVSFDVTPYMATNSGHLQVQFAVSEANPGGTIFNIDDVSVQALDASARGANDNFANATVLSGTDINLQATNTYSTKEPGEPNHAGNSGGHSLWWDWTAPDWGIVTITTDGSSFDTLLAAYTGTVVSNLTRVASNDNDNGGRSPTSLISFPVSPGADYKIAVDGANGDSGLILLSLNFVADTKAPTVAFTSPSAGAVVTNNQVTVQGTAADNVAVALVEYRLENAAGTNDYQPVVGTNRWSVTVTNLAPGPNTVRVQATDMSGNVSAGVARAFYYDITGPAKGAYAGLFTDTNNPTTTNAGYFSANVATKGKFSAKLLLNGHSYSVSGAFGFDGSFTKTIAGPGKLPLTVQLSLDLSGQNQITGTVSMSTWTASLQANRQMYSKTSPAPQAGKYTLAIDTGDPNAGQPAGFGFGSVTVDVSGNVKFSGTLGDSAKASQRTFLSQAGEWPLYLSLTGGKEIMQGWLVFTNTADGDLNGLVSWVKQPQKAKLYPNGFTFTNQVGVVGSLYTSTKGVPVLNLPSGGVVVLSGGNLPEDVSTGFTIDNNNKVTGTNKLSLTFSTSTGTFKGSVPVPGTTKPVAINGAVLQKQNAGFGVFVGTNQTGQVTVGE